MPMTMLLSVLLHLSPAWGAPHPVEEVSASEASAPVLLNDATSDQLASLDGVAEADARAIVALREDRGGLSSVEELRVLGLGEPVLASLRSQTALEVRIRPPERDMAFSSASEVLAKFSGEPTVNQVQMWAADYVLWSVSIVAQRGKVIWSYFTFLFQFCKDRAVFGVANCVIESMYSYGVR